MVAIGRLQLATSSLHDRPECEYCRVQVNQASRQMWNQSSVRNMCQSELKLAQPDRGKVGFAANNALSNLLVNVVGCRSCKLSLKVDRLIVQGDVYSTLFVQDMAVFIRTTYPDNSLDP